MAMESAGALGAASLGLSFLESRKQRKEQKRALASQERSQREATARAAAESRAQSRERRRLNRRKPEVGALLRDEQAAARRGPGATVLSTSGGAGRSALMLGGQSTLLGS